LTNRIKSLSIRDKQGDNDELSIDQHDKEHDNKLDKLPEDTVIQLSSTDHNSNTN